jgi:hypothetical protein
MNSNNSNNLELIKENLFLKESLANELIKFGVENNFLTNENLMDLKKLKEEFDLIQRESIHYKKLTENYIVSNQKLKNAISKSLPISSNNGLFKTLVSFSINDTEIKQTQ